MTGLVIVADRSSATNRSLAAAWRANGVSVRRLGGAQLRGARLLGRLDGTVFLGRVDVSRRLDGVGESFWELRRLEGEGRSVLNGAGALLRCHDKLHTARSLYRAGLPHPGTVLIRDCSSVPPFDGPYVVKPRFGSWGRGIERCEDAAELRACLRRASRRRLFRRRGVLVQEYVENAAVDLRVVVAGGHVVGAVQRVAAAGEWRTNISLGGTRQPVDAPLEARELAVAAAEAVGGDLVGVDLLPTADGYTVLELNGAVDFTDAYGDDVFVRAARLLVPPTIELPVPDVQPAPQLAPIPIDPR
ncbi:MAG: ATP-grasp domain-containing protein [Gaiellaceae bacterium]